MSSKIISLLFLTWNIQNIFTQDDILSCDYGIKESVYACSLHIVNPNGNGSFTEVSGKHLNPFDDVNVEEIFTVADPKSESRNIPSIICEKFQNVTKIMFIAIGLEEINVNSFNQCKSLQNVDLYNNRISKIDENSFVANLDIELLNIAENKLTTLPENLFVNQLMMNVIYLNNNDIREMPDNVFKPFKNLKFINLSSNRIVNLNVNWFNGLETLEQLFLSSNQIEELPKDVFSFMINLSFLSLDRNSIKVIQFDAFGNLPKLTRLDIQQNQVDAVDAKFVDNTGISIFIMNGNVCADKYITDVTQGKEAMKNDLKICFENYEDLQQRTTVRATTPLLTTTTDAGNQNNVKKLLLFCGFFLLAWMNKIQTN